MPVLIVESDSGLRGLMRQHLHDRGLEVAVADALAVALDLVARRAFDVVIVDLSLPDGSAFELLAHLRGAGGHAHVIVLSSSAGERDRVTAAEAGADDYVVKPFSIRELVTRVLAVPRRPDVEHDGQLRVGPLAIDLHGRQVTVDDRRLDLTVKEFDLLAFLATRSGHVFTRDQLLRAVWNSTSEWQGPATVTEHIRRLRAKIEHDPRRPLLVRTVRGVGYRLDRPPDGSDRPPDPVGPGTAPGTLIQVGDRIVSADDAAGTLLGYAHAADLVGRDILDLVAPGSMGGAHERLPGIPRDQPPRSRLVDLRCADGSEAPFEVVSSAIDWNGRPAVHTLVTPVADPSSRLRRLAVGVLTELTEAVIITDLHLHVRSWNHAAELLYGWTAEDAIGRHVLDLLHWLGDEKELAGAWENLELRGRWNGRAGQTGRDGAAVEVLSTTTMVLDESGEPVGILSVNRVEPATTAGDHVLHDEDQIRLGLANDEFDVFYLPVVALDDRRMVCVEALARWHHPTRGLLEAAEFIDSARSSEVIVELGGVVLDRACRQAGAWRRDGADIDVAVNLSVQQLKDPGLVDRISAALGTAGLAPGALWLEVTETALVDETDVAADVLRRLVDLGVHIAVDDFGTGWASLVYLRRFPVQALKIDRSFVAGLGRNPVDTAIVRSILGLAAELDLPVVAEGIETVAQQEALQELGCSIGQGFLYGAPCPAADVPIHRAGRLEPATGPSG